MIEDIAALVILIGIVNICMLIVIVLQFDRITMIENRIGCDKVKKDIDKELSKRIKRLKT